MATVLLRNFYVGITSWYWYVLDTITGGNFLGINALEVFNVIEGLVGIPPTNEGKIEITSEHVMQRLEVIEDNVPSVDMIREIDKGILDGINKLDGCLKDIAKSIKSLEPTKASNQTIRIDKLEEVIDTFGTTFSSLKSKKKVASASKMPKFIFVPRNTTKVDTSYAGNEELRMVKEAPIFKDSRGGAPDGKTTFTPPIVATNSIAGGPFPSSTIHELGKNDDALDFEKT